jgi:hypothetical protein
MAGMIARPPDVDTVLQQAADYLEQHGWIQGGHGNHGGPRCVEGAILSVLGNHLYVSTAEAVHRLRLEVHTPLPLVRWNDQRGRSQAEVIAALRGTGART